MSSERKFDFYGDVTPEQYEAGKSDLLLPEEVHAGYTYIGRFRQPPAANEPDISDYEVLVQGINRLGFPTTICLAFAIPKTRFWDTEVLRLAFPDDGLFLFNNIEGMVPEWENGLVDTGYLLPKLQKRG